MRKSISLLLILAMLLGVLGATAMAEAAYTAGTYTASAAGFGGNVTVTVTVDENGITDVKVEGPDETPTVGGVAVANMPAAILAAGSADVDMTTGATVTSTAILTALREALAEASGADLTVKMAPGTYTAQAYGFQQISPITVTMTVDETGIRELSFDGNLDSVAMIRSVNRYLIPRILENQSVGVDAITGATSTSNAVLSGARDCLAQALAAGGSDAAAISAFMKPEPVIEAQETLDVDVLVVGMGAAGISAATAAAEAQKAAGKPVSVLAIEKDGRYGGTGAFTGEPMSINPPRYKEQYNNGEDYMDRDALLAAWTEYVEGDAKMEVVEKFLDNSGETADWLYYDHGFLINNPTSGFGANTYRCKQQYVSVATAEEGRDYGMDVSAGQNTMVDKYYERFVSDYVKLGGKYMLETEGYALLYDEAENRVTGVKAKGHDGTDYTINAKSVILCTGGFAGSEELEKEYLSKNPYFDHFGDEQWTMIGMHENDGKMLKAALEIGAGTYNISVVPMIHFATSNIVIHDYPVNTFKPDEPGYGKVLWYGWDQTWTLNEIPDALILCSDIPWVNVDGERFEAEGALFGWWQAGPSYWAIWSQDQIDGLAANGFSSTLSTLAAGSQGVMPGNLPIPEVYDVLDKLVAQGYVVKADTYEALAEAMGVPAETFVKTMADYNAFCESGVDEQFGKDAAKLVPAGNGPFYALKGYSACFATNGSLDINENFEVLKADGETPIGGLWACGCEASGVMYSEKKPYVTYGGAAIGFAYTSGRLSGGYAAAYADSLK
ncbi:MAG: FAD-binding protein [Clostridia bacterium]|nr:FAD-binding protein [Clostridia bacterium]